MAKKVTDDLLGIEPPKIPDPPIIKREPDRDDLDNLPDGDAAKNAKERIEAAKRRRGRSSLRQDLVTAGIGAGVAIPR